MTDRGPFITGNDHPLPFGNLTWKDFERLCAWLLKSEFPEVRHPGAAGADRGVDLEAVDAKGRLTFVQCKNYEKKSFGPKEAREAIRKILDWPSNEQPHAFLLIVSKAVSKDAGEALLDEAGTLKCSYWDLTELDLRVKRNPSVLKEFF
ncbi:MAG: restriction endonuclease, partial [Acidobacteriota bacterium]